MGEGVADSVVPGVSAGAFWLGAGLGVNTGAGEVVVVVAVVGLASGAFVVTGGVGLGGAFFFGFF